MAAALEKLAQVESFATITDPVEWQREVRPPVDRRPHCP
jgi:hypothetical protein